MYIRTQRALAVGVSGVWAQQVTRTLDRDKANQPKKIEKLFVWKGSEA